MKDKEEIFITFDQYCKFIYNYKLINSLIFSTNIDSYITNTLKIDQIESKSLLEGLKSYLEFNQGQNIFDEKNKENFYFLIDYLCNQNEFKNNENVIETINELKILLNRIQSYDNNDFVRSQIVLRDYGIMHYNWNFMKLKRIPDFVISIYKREYYESISNDIVVLNCLNSDDEKFYSEDYKKILLDKNFYRSINSLMIDNIVIFEHNSDFLNRINFILNKDLDILNSDCDTRDFTSNDIDDEFFEILNVTNKMIKKLSRKVKKYIK